MPTQWLNGRLVEEADPGLRALDASRSADALTCITTARVTAGRARHQAYHVRRLVRDAHTLGLGSVDPGQVGDAFAQLGRAAFGDSSGIVRIEVRPGSSRGCATLHATARPIGDETPLWSARIAPTVHPGPRPFSGAKLGSDAAYEEARAFSARNRVNESLIFDALGRLVEGARSNIVIVRRDGTLVTPDLALGAVAGIAREILCERTAKLAIETIDRDALETAREVIAVNAVRGARPITRLDDRIIGGGVAGPWARQLDATLNGSG